MSICKHITKRSYQRRAFIWCRKLKKEITWDDCKNCTEIESRENKGILKRTPLKKSDKPIKKKSNKLAELERNRFSILTDDLEHCYICKKIYFRLVPREDLHEIFGGRNRQISMRKGFVVPLCRKCHDNERVKKFLKKKLIINYCTTEEKIQEIRELLK